MPNLSLPLDAAPETVPASTCRLYHGDCLDVMPRLEAKSVHMVFADLPYGVTNCDWDKKPFPLRGLTDCIDPLATLKCVHLFTSVQPFTTQLISAMTNFRYELIWHRKAARGFQTANKRPMRAHETITVFGSAGATYNPQKTKAKRTTTHTPYIRTSEVYGGDDKLTEKVTYKDRHPTTVLVFDESDLRHDTLNGHISKRIHPTQKPVALLEWLIKTYTNEGDTVLDPVFGSNTTGVACARLGRNYIGIEKDPEYFRIGVERVNAERTKLGLQPCEAIA